jgi:manganese/iron transport system substrate-binding protein
LSNPYLNVPLQWNWQRATAVFIICRPFRKLSNQLGAWDVKVGYLGVYALIRRADKRRASLCHHNAKGYCLVFSDGGIGQTGGGRHGQRQRHCASGRGCSPLGANAPNVLALEETHIVFYNGLGLEPWIRHVEAMSDDQLTLVEVAKKADFAPMMISTGQYKGEPDPHMWMDPDGAAAYIDVIAKTLAEHLPEQADAFYARAEETRKALTNLSQAVKERLEGIPQTNRTLITSEAGFGYFARAFAFETHGVWGSNYETQGSAQAMAKMSELLAEKRPSALFFESTTPSIHMDALSRETSLPLAGPLYVDSLSGAGGPAAHYSAMLRHNAEVMHTALGGATAE